MTTVYISRLVKIAEKAAEANASAFETASATLTTTLTGDGLIHLFGSGHSVLPTQETYPRYGSFIGFNPLTDPRVMWHNILGPGGVRELLWLERTEGYAEKFLDHQPLNPGDSIVIFGHSGRNASGIDTALYAKKRGLTVVAITAKANLDKPATHSSGKRLADVADIVIDTGAPIEDAIVSITGWSRPVAGSSTVLAMMMMHELLAPSPAFADSEEEAQKALALFGTCPVAEKALVNVPYMPTDLPTWYDVAMSHYLADHHYAVDNMWTSAPAEDLLPGIRSILDTLPPHPAHFLWLNWGPVPPRQDMAYSIEADIYLALYGSWKDPGDEAKYADWARSHMSAMSDLAVGIQLADENLGQRPARFASDAAMAKLDRVRAEYDPDGLFNSWMGRI